MRRETYDIVLRFVDGYGWLGIVMNDREVFRTGEYHIDEYSALDAVNVEIERRENFMLSSED